VGSLLWSWHQAASINLKPDGDFASLRPIWLIDGGFYIAAALASLRIDGLVLFIFGTLPFPV